MGRGVPFGVAVFADGSFVMGRGSRGFRWEDRGRVIEYDLEYYHYGRDGKFANDLASLPGQPRYGAEAGGVVSFPYIPFTTAPTVTTSGRHAVFASGGTPEIRYRATSGAVERIVRWRAERRSSTEHLERYRDYLLGQITDENRRRQYARLFTEDLPIPTQLPVFTDLMGDAEGHVWVEHYRLPWEEERRWTIIGPAGRWLGEITSPPGFRPMRIGADHVLGLHLDDMRIERVQVYGLDRSAELPSPE